MARFVQVRFGNLKGESSHEFALAGRLSNRSFNVIPDKKGFLRTYKGKQSLFAPSLLADFSSKWVLAAKTFVDIFGRKRRVFVAKDTIYTLDG